MRLKPCKISLKNDKGFLNIFQIFLHGHQLAFSIFLDFKQPIYNYTFPRPADPSSGFPSS